MCCLMVSEGFCFRASKAAAGILCVFQGWGCAVPEEKIRCRDGRGFSESAIIKIIALQTVWVQCDTKASHMCIFPSDGTNRIRFTGQDYQVQSQPDASGPPKTYLFCDSAVIIDRQRPIVKKKRGRSPSSFCFL